MLAQGGIDELTDTGRCKNARDVSNGENNHIVVTVWQDLRSPQKRLAASCTPLLGWSGA